MSNDEVNNPVAEQEGKGKPPMLSILYETGIITAETKMNKTGRKIGYLLKKLANVTTRIGTFGLVGVGTDEDDVVPGQKLSFAGITEGSYASEFLARDRRRFKQEAWKALNPGEKAVGSYIFPCFYGRPHESKTDERYAAGIDGQQPLFWEVDTKDQANHYIERHCYYNFKVYGEDFAKMAGIEKAFDKRTGKQKDKYGFGWSVRFSSYVGWRMSLVVYYGRNWEECFFDCMLKEDLDPSDGGLAKWAASSIGSLALAAGSGGASILAAGKAGVGAIAAGEAAGNSLMDAAGAAIAKRRATPFVDKKGKPTGKTWGDVKGGIGDAKDELTMGFATQKAIEASMGGIMSGAGGIISATKKAGMEFAGEVGQAWTGLPRTFFGGKAAYQTSITEFIAHKSFLPLLFVEARTSAVYSDRWRNEMNRRLIQYDFYFGKDPEVSLAKDVGMEFGIGYDKDSEKEEDEWGIKRKKGTLTKFHGWVQLQDTIVFQGSHNPFIDYWIKEDIFVYQLRESKRPKITLESLFPGFRGTLTNSIGQDGGTDTLNIQNKQTKITKEKHTCSSGYAFCYMWTGGGVSSSGGFNVESCGLKTGYGDKVNQYLGGDTPTKKSWSDFPSHLKENQYQKVNFPKSNGLVKFGRGQKYVVMGYMKGDQKEEEIYVATDPANSVWVLEYKGGSTHPVELYCEVNNTRIIYSRIEMNQNPFNLSWTVPIEGFSGVEGWGNNPPDAFSGGGGAQISLPVGLGNIGQATGGLGMSLPNVSSLDISTQMPEQIQSQLNTNEININLQQQEMPKMQEMSSSQQEWISGQQTESGFGEQTGWHSTERGETGSHKKDETKEKKRDK